MTKNICLVFRANLQNGFKVIFRMKTVTLLQVLCVLITLYFNECKTNGDESCESRIETRAVLLSCPEKDTGCDDDDPLSKITLAEEYGLYEMTPNEFWRLKTEAEREFPKRVTECKRKLVITMKLNNKGKIDCNDGFIVIDHVYDPISRGKARLLSPVIIKLRQEQIIQLYPLQFQKVVNSDPSEYIYSKETCNDYKGCSMDPSQPTCGITTYNGYPIPFSEGYCCSQNRYVNSQRVVPSDKHENAFIYKDPSLFSHGKNRFTRKQNSRPVLINPDLLRMRSVDVESRGLPAAGKVNDAQNSMCKTLQKPPIYFFEHDQQIVRTLDRLLSDVHNVDGSKKSGGTESNDDTENGGCHVDPQHQDNAKNFEIALSNYTNLKNNFNGSCNNQIGSSGSSKNYSEVTILPNSKNADSVEVIKKVDDKFINGIRYVNGFGQFQFMENKFERKPTRSVKSLMQAFEEKRGNWASQRQRKKRLVEDDEGYVQSFQVNNVGKEKKNENLKTISQSKCEDMSELEICAQTVSPVTSKNSTLPVFFFARDKNIICPENSCQNKSETNSEPSEYEDSNLDLEAEKNGQAQFRYQPKKQQEEALPTITRLRTQGSGTWNVNANVERGNLFKLDMSKADKDDRFNQAEKTEQIYFERQKLLPNGEEENTKDENKPRYGHQKYRMSSPRRFKGRHFDRYRAEEIVKNGKHYLKGESRRLHGELNGEIEFNSDSGNRGDIMDIVIPNEKNHRKIRMKIQHAWNREINHPSDTEERHAEGKRILQRGRQMWNGLPDLGKNHARKTYYPYAPSWSGSGQQQQPKGLRESSESKMKDNIVNLLAYDYPQTKDPESKYLVSSQNIFFADTKFHRKDDIDPLYNVRKNDAGSGRGITHNVNSQLNKVLRFPNELQENVIYDRNRRKTAPTRKQRKFFMVQRRERRSINHKVFFEDSADIQRSKIQTADKKEGQERDKRAKRDMERLMQSKFRRDLNDKRQMSSTKKNKEGSTDSTTTTKGTRYEDSSHCLRYSDLWYSVYIIKKPQLAHLVGVQVYDRQTMCDGTSNWRDLTKGYMIRLGTFLQRAEDDVPTVSMSFTPQGPVIPKTGPKLDTDNYRLLIPSHLTNEKKSNLYPEFGGGPSEYLLVNKNEISESGADCNMIGTSFEAFARQPDRCSQPPGSCLNRQPVDLWREDMESRIRGKRGKYFIENFGSVANTSIKSYTNLTGEFLALDYYGEYSSVLEIEMRADGNAIVRQGLYAQIPTVYIENIARKKTRIVLTVMNMGLSSALFRPRLGECPSNVDPTWCPLEGPLVTISPQQRHDFKLELTGELPATRVYCAVEVLNQKNKRVARRKIVIKKADRCICAFYCKCHCLAESQKSTCIELTKEEYNAAGLFDPIPQRDMPSGKGSEVLKENVKAVITSTMYSLLVLGIFKAVVGAIHRRLGICGVQVIVGPRVLSRYYESDISRYEVVYDDCGFPIHPETCKTVQIVPLWLEMFFNFWFFYLYFMKIIWLLITSSPCCKSICFDCKDCWKADSSEQNLAEHGEKSPYNTEFYAYNAMTYPIKKNKLKDSIMYNLYKTDEDPLEEDDTEFVLEEIKRYQNITQGD